MILEWTSLTHFCSHEVHRLQSQIDHPTGSDRVTCTGDPDVAQLCWHQSGRDHIRSCSYFCVSCESKGRVSRCTGVR